MTDIVSVEDMLNNAKAAAAAKAAGQKAGLSKVQQMLAGVELDTVELSPVAKQLAATEKAKPSSTPYTEQEWYVKAKISQLRSQIEIYSNLPGLDPSGSMMNSLTAEVNALVKKQQDELAETNRKADEAKAKLAEQEAAEKLAKSIPDVETMLKRAKGGAAGEELPTYESTVNVDKEKEAAVAAMLKKIGANVNTSA